MDRRKDMYDRLEKILAEKKISKRRMSIDLEIPYTTLASMFKRRSMSVDIETIKKIASYLNTDLDFLVSGDIYPMSLKIGTRIKQFRLQKNMTQSELSKLSGYTLKEIKDIEENKKILTDDEYDELSQFVCDSIYDFNFDSDLEMLSTPVGKNYVIIWNRGKFCKFYLHEEQAESVYIIAKQFNDIYKKDNGLDGVL